MFVANVLRWLSGKFNSRGGALLFILACLFLCAVVSAAFRLFDHGLFMFGEKSESHTGFAVLLFISSWIVLTPLTLPCSFADFVGIMEAKKMLQGNECCPVILGYWAVFLSLVILALTTRRRYWVVALAVLLALSARNWASLSVVMV